MSEVREAAPVPATAGAWAWTVSRPWWVQVLAVYAAARLFTTVVFLWVASVQEQNPWTAEHPAYFPYCLLYTSPSPRDGLLSRMPSSA